METQLVAVPRRERLRERERLSRSRRTNKLSAMHGQIRLLEQTALALLLSPNDDRKWDEFLDPDVLKSWTTLRQTDQFTSEIQRLKSERGMLQRVLTERELARRTVEAIVAKDAAESEWESKRSHRRRREESDKRETTLDETADRADASLPNTEEIGLMKVSYATEHWDASVRRWSRITRAVFKPWTVEACEDLIDECMREIRRVSFDDGDFESTGLTFFGWRDRRKLDRERGVMKVSLTRIYDNFDAEMVARGWWEMLQSPSKFAQGMLGPNVKWYYEVLQHVTPDIFITRLTEQYPDSPYQIHQLVLIARLRLDDSLLEIHRSIQSPELEIAINDDTAIWTSNFHWLKHDIKKRNENGECIKVRTSANGTFAASTVEYANRWMRELAISLVRIDTTILGQKLLT